MNCSQKILVVHDDVDQAEVIDELLRSEGFEVEVLTNPLEASEVVGAWTPHLVIAAVHMPRLDGLSLTADLRRRSDTGILLLGENEDAHDRTIGLRFGADDYLVGPHDPDELIERAKAILRRVARSAGGSAAPRTSSPRPVDERPDQSRARGRVVIEPLLGEVRVGERRVNLSRKELRLMLALAEQVNRTFSRDELQTAIWGARSPRRGRAVDMLVLRLREKLEQLGPVGPVLETVRGFGYRLRIAADPGSLGAAPIQVDRPEGAPSSDRWSFAGEASADAVWQ